MGRSFPNRLLGAATLDRLPHNAYRLVLDGDSYRRPKPLAGAVAESMDPPVPEGEKNRNSVKEGI